MSFWAKSKPNSIKEVAFSEEFTLKERVKKRKKLEQRYPKDSFSYLVIEGLQKFQNQTSSYKLIGVQNNMPISFLIEYLRKALDLGKTVSLFIEVNGKVKQVGKKIGDVNRDCKSQDGFLYFKLKTQNAFGSLSEFANKLQQNLPKKGEIEKNKKCID